MARRPRTKESRSLSAEAYDRLESMIVSTELAPGAKFTLQRLQEASGFGRTPVLDAVKRLASNRLIIVNPRSGLRIAPVDLAQERTLLSLRIEMEVIACGLASERATSHDHMVFRQFIRDLESAEESLSLDQFNITDRLLNRAIIAASREPLLENTLMPLQTLYRRTGWLFHNYVAMTPSLSTTIKNHILLLRAILTGDREETVTFVRKMISEVYDLLDQVRQRVDPLVLDAGLADLKVHTGFHTS
ncbi:GntR family transcriptional regulator [Agrobacterium rhizogenes]|uniref:GntR family transcriptional regulator n=1 Tax=Rhizobium rhizogenes TaxID=359 RepID=UPI001572C0C6|nr:GntR family transcriptional regulator [Rhizobium rhizogenes]NTF52804.1 GntR family transcriptional regulator [Rhizobium rhizogenes]NTG04723.1 GntR family transcriptional regulator [Rhizobium rhizogenes]NTG25137.1 GntR family transcriptional regulator [Rhizobium rhizogenes]NTG31911.1 GntR family transcriptional regulator [Rhizobium rhizogenes]NTG38939.1 GntR family transcriptional regulator [Rhizobium rhizogenes]